MNGPELFQRLCRKAAIGLPSISSSWRKILWRSRGATIGPGTKLPPCSAPWPHQVRIGADCKLHRGISFNYDNYWTPGPSIILGDRVFVGQNVEFNIQGRIEIGDDSLIAAGCVFVDHDHVFGRDQPTNTQPNEIGPIRIGKNVWFGVQCVVLRGVEIGDNAVIGANSVVTRPIPADELWAGSPARHIRKLPARSPGANPGTG